MERILFDEILGGPDIRPRIRASAFTSSSVAAMHTIQQVLHGRFDFSESTGTFYFILESKIYGCQTKENQFLYRANSRNFLFWTVFLSKRLQTL